VAGGGDYWHQRPADAADLEHNKRAVVAFFTRAFSDHEPDDAVAKDVGSQNIQHNPGTPDGPAAFAESTKKPIAKCSDVSVEIKRVIAEANLV
jgi:predicted SnoaL-like aldol condensation-catalyzing enzyme